MEEEVLSIDVRHDEPIALTLVKELQPPCHLVLYIIQIWGVLLVIALPIQAWRRGWEIWKRKLILLHNYWWIACCERVSDSSCLLLCQLLGTLGLVSIGRHKCFTRNIQWLGGSPPVLLKNIYFFVSWSFVLNLKTLILNTPIYLSALCILIHPQLLKLLDQLLLLNMGLVLLNARWSHAGIVMNCFERLMRVHIHATSKLSYLLDGFEGCRRWHLWYTTTELYVLIHAWHYAS